MKIIAQNKKINLEYEVLETFEAGLVLTGSEIKSIRLGRVNVTGAFVKPQNGEIWAINLHLGSAEEPDRTRKLLLNKAEILNLIGKTEQKGLTIVPVKLYIKKGKAKLEIALARGKKIYDHREDLKKRDIERQVRKEF